MCLQLRMKMAPCIGRWMQTTKSARLLISTTVGFLVGVLALVVLRWSVPVLEVLVHFLCYPGIRLGRFWTDAGFPPHGEAAFGVIALGILIQWTILGFVVGLCRRRRRV
jgi:hypothetical protein